MKRNFRVSSEISLSLDGANFDLHSDYKLRSLGWSVSESSLNLEWAMEVQGERKWLVLVFRDVLLLDLVGIDLDMPRKADAALDFLGFLHPADRSVMSGFLPEEMATDQHHFVLRFLGGLTIKIFAREAILSEA